MTSARLASLATGLWAGLLLCIGGLAAPSAFAVLTPGQAGALASRIFAVEAYLSLAVACALFLWVRSCARRSPQLQQRSSGVSVEPLLVLGTLFCTVAGHFALQPLMASARAGETKVSFAMLHAVSAGLFGLKTILVLALAWRLTCR